MLMVSILHPKHIDYWGGLKNKTQPFVNYKKHILLAKTDTGLEQKDRKFLSKQMQLKITLKLISSGRPQYSFQL
jgi:hypothetical protein